MNIKGYLALFIFVCILFSSCSGASPIPTPASHLPTEVPCQVILDQPIGVHHSENKRFLYILIDRSPSYFLVTPSALERVKQVVHSLASIEDRIVIAWIGIEPRNSDKNTIFSGRVESYYPLPAPLKPTDVPTMTPMPIPTGTLPAVTERIIPTLLAQQAIDKIATATHEKNCKEKINSIAIENESKNIDAASNSIKLFLGRFDEALSKTSSNLSQDSTGSPLRTSIEYAQNVLLDDHEYAHRQLLIFSDMDEWLFSTTPTPVSPTMGKEKIDQVVVAMFICPPENCNQRISSWKKYFFSNSPPLFLYPQSSDPEQITRSLK